jgi:hypothetical protein
VAEGTAPLEDSIEENKNAPYLTRYYSWNDDRLNMYLGEK